MSNDQTQNLEEMSKEFAELVDIICAKQQPSNGNRHDVEAAVRFLITACRKITEDLDATNLTDQHVQNFVFGDHEMPYINDPAQRQLRRLVNETIPADLSIGTRIALLGIPQEHPFDRFITAAVTETNGIGLTIIDPFQVLSETATTAQEAGGASFS